LRLRVAAQFEHADQALGRRAGCFAELFETDGRLAAAQPPRISKRLRHLYEDAFGAEKINRLEIHRRHGLDRAEEFPPLQL
jgi:hypothetical protein